MRRHLFCAALAVAASLSACSKTVHQQVVPTKFGSPREAFLQVCANPGSHADIAAKVRGLGWQALTRNQIPSQVIGNGMVTWTVVTEASDQNMLIAAGQLNDTSFCRVYSRGAPATSLQGELEQTKVLGETLGEPDIRQRIGERDVVGWQVKSGKNWRALHLDSASSAPTGGTGMPIILEMTRPIS